MKLIRLIILLVSGLTGCRHPAVESDEVTALFIRQDLSYIDCICCTAYNFQVGDKAYESDAVPAPYNGAAWPVRVSTPVWIRYSRRQLTGACNPVNNWIQLISIRNR